MTLIVIALLQATAPSVCVAPVIVPAGTPVMLRTTESLSSKVNGKGDLVRLEVADDVLTGGAVAIAAGTPALGQVTDAQSTGGIGTGGKLFVSPLHVAAAGRTIRLAGLSSHERGASAGLVAGMALLTPLFSGRSALIPVGTRIGATVARAVTLHGTCPVAAPRR